MWSLNLIGPAPSARARFILCDSRRPRYSPDQSSPASTESRLGNQGLRSCIAKRQRQAFGPDKLGPEVVGEMRAALDHSSTGEE
jgi:hypothetical protein